VPTRVGVMDDAYIPAPSFEMLAVYIELWRWQHAEGRDPGMGWQFRTRVREPFRETQVHCRLGAVSVRVGGCETDGGKVESPARIWLVLLRVDNVPMTWMDKLDPIPVDHFEDLIGVLERLAWDPNLYGEYWERYRPDHPWYVRASA